MLRTPGTRVQYVGAFKAIAGKCGTVVMPRPAGARPERWSSVDFDGEIYDVEVRNLKAIEGVAELEARAKTHPGLPALFDFTQSDEIAVLYFSTWVDPLVYRHNGVAIDRARAVELIGERA